MPAREGAPQPAHTHVLTHTHTDLAGHEHLLHERRQALLTAHQHATLLLLLQRTAGLTEAALQHFIPVSLRVKLMDVWVAVWWIGCAGKHICSATRHDGTCDKAAAEAGAGTGQPRCHTHRHKTTSLLLRGLCCFWRILLPLSFRLAARCHVLGAAEGAVRWRHRRGHTRLHCMHACVQDRVWGSAPGVQMLHARPGQRPSMPCSPDAPCTVTHTQCLRTSW
jgi:hypothetical protein